MAALGIALAVFGAWTAFKIGPSGEVHFSATSKAPGAIVVEPDVLNSLSFPVRVKATRTDGGGPVDGSHVVFRCSRGSGEAGRVHGQRCSLSRRDS